MAVVSGLESPGPFRMTRAASRRVSADGQADGFGDAGDPGARGVRFPKRPFVVLPAVLALSVSTAAGAQEDPPLAGAGIHRSIPPPGAATHRVVPGERYEADELRSWFYGDNYRNLWTTPIEVAVLDLDTVGGGLTPLRAGGFGQSISLHFTGRDGRRYTVRSMDKDATRRIPDNLKRTIVGDVLQDLISAMLPAAALVADPLMEAAGILHSGHTLVVIPDDPRLGEYRERFAGLIGMLQEHPSEGPDDTVGFAGSRKVSGTDTVLDDLEKGPCDRVDARAFLKARLLDFLINDKDRHGGQWRWARFPNGECHTWLPIPEDRDQALIDFDGFAMSLARTAFPIQIRFEGDYPSLSGLTLTGWELDRELLVELDRPAWDSVVAEFRGHLSDPVIEDAVRRLPPPYYEIVGDSLAAILKSRRDALPEFAARYYELISRQAEIKATDRDEYLHCEHLPSGDLVVRIGVAGPDGDGSPAPYFQRTFRAEETGEVRIYLRGGDDRAEVSGARAQITVRIAGGGGDDTFTNSSAAGASKTAFHDARGTNRFVKGRGARIDERAYRRPPATHTPNAQYALDWGRRTMTLPFVMANPDLGAFFRVTHTRQYYGFRKYPFAARHDFGLGLATRGLKPFASYTGQFHQLVADLDAVVHIEYSGIEVRRFNGFGNDTKIPQPSGFYDVEQNQFVFAPAMEFRTRVRDTQSAAGPMQPLQSNLTVDLGPIIKYSNTPANRNREGFLGSLEHPLYGAGSFGQVGAQGGVRYDTRDNPAYPTRGFFIILDGAIYPRVWDVESVFGSLAGEAHAFLTAPIPTRPTLAARAGGKRLWGSYPFHESAFLGGPGMGGLGISRRNLRGFRENRFAGDASLYVNSELRFVLASLDILVPTDMGLFLAADTGRVFFAEDPAEADRWHTGVGGGIWMSFLDRQRTVSFAVVRGADLTGLYLRAGFLF